MNEKVKLNVNTAVIFGIMLAAVLFLIFRDYQRESKMHQMMSLRQEVGRDGRKAQDPYLQYEVKNRIIKGYTDIQACYKDFLKTNPEVTDGDVKMDWQIDTDGDVLSPEIITSPIQSDALHSCMKEKISEWKFPEPVMKKYVTHTFKFEKKI